jgi:hypothetical protein
MVRVPPRSPRFTFGYAWRSRAGAEGEACPVKGEGGPPRYILALPGAFYRPDDLLKGTSCGIGRWADTGAAQTRRGWKVI